MWKYKLDDKKIFLINENKILKTCILKISKFQKKNIHELIKIYI